MDPRWGAFNRWAKGTDIESWRSRHVDEIARRLMHEAGVWLARKVVD